MIHKHKEGKDLGKKLLERVDLWPLTRSSTSSLAWHMFSRCIYHPLLAQALTGPHPCRQSELCVLATTPTTKAPRTPIPHIQTRRFSWNKANITATQSSHASPGSGHFLPVSLPESFKALVRAEPAAWRGFCRVVCGTREMSGKKRKLRDENVQCKVWSTNTVVTSCSQMTHLR